MSWLDLPCCNTILTIKHELRHCAGWLDGRTRQDSSSLTVLVQFLLLPQLFLVSTSDHFLLQMFAWDSVSQAHRAVSSVSSSEFFLPGCLMRLLFLSWLAARHFHRQPTLLASLVGVKSPGPILKVQVWQWKLQWADRCRHINFGHHQLALALSLTHSPYALNRTGARSRAMPKILHSGDMTHGQPTTISLSFLQNTSSVCAQKTW